MPIITKMKNSFPVGGCCNILKGLMSPTIFSPPTDSCPQIIGYYADINDAPAGTNVGDLAVERYVDVSENQHIHLYEWNGLNWDGYIDTSFRPVDGLFDEMIINNLDNGWQISLDQGATWITDPANVPIDPPSATVDVWFKKGVTGCIYTNIPQIPLAIYCVESYLVDTSDPLFFFGLINGVDAGDLGAVLASYTNWDSNPTAIPSVTNGASGLAIVIFRDSATPAFTNMGVYTPFDGPPTVDWTPSVINCTRNCYRAVFNSTDLDTEGMTSISAMSGDDSFNWGSIIPFSDPTAATQNLAGLITGGFLEPTATMTYTFNGLEVTVDICTVKDMYQFVWGTDVSDLGTANFNII